MEILINNSLQEIPDQATVISALNHLFPASLKGIAVAVNNQVVSRNEWAEFVLAPSDKVNVIRATQGG